MVYIFLPELTACRLNVMFISEKQGVVLGVMLLPLGLGIRLVLVEDIRSLRAISLDLVLFYLEFSCSWRNLSTSFLIIACLAS